MYFYGAGAAHLIEQLQLPESHIAPFTVSEASAADLRDEENSKRNIIGFGYGEKLVGGAPQGVLAICMYVVRKATPEHIHPKYLAEYLVERFDKGVPPTTSWVAPSSTGDTRRRGALHNAG